MSATVDHAHFFANSAFGASHDAIPPTGATFTSQGTSRDSDSGASYSAEGSAAPSAAPSDAVPPRTGRRVRAAPLTQEQLRERSRMYNARGRHKVAQQRVQLAASLEVTGAALAAERARQSTLCHETQALAGMHSYAGEMLDFLRAVPPPADNESSDGRVGGAAPPGWHRAVSAMPQFLRAWLTDASAGVKEDLGLQWLGVLAGPHGEAYIR